VSEPASIGRHPLRRPAIPFEHLTYRSIRSPAHSISSLIRPKANRLATPHGDPFRLNQQTFRVVDFCIWRRVLRAHSCGARGKWPILSDAPITMIVPFAAGAPDVVAAISKVWPLGLRN
jgi:hypothetical protein